MSRVKKGTGKVLPKPLSP